MTESDFENPNSDPIILIKYPTWIRCIGYIHIEVISRFGEKGNRSKIKGD